VTAAAAAPNSLAN